MSEDTVVEPGLATPVEDGTLVEDETQVDDEALLESLLVEEVSIDGMCGVY